jgi:hypothetical protein
MNKFFLSPKKIIWFQVIGLMLMATSANAQDAKKKKKAMVLEEVRIEGEVQKPEAYFILQPKSFEFLQSIETKAKFNAQELVVDAVKSDSF